MHYVEALKVLGNILQRAEKSDTILHKKENASCIKPSLGENFAHFQATRQSLTSNMKCKIYRMMVKATHNTAQ